MALLSETNLAGKTAVVLGASGSCGNATARMLAEGGVNLVLGGRSRDELETLQAEIEASGGRTLVVGTDVSRRHHLERTVEAALEHFGGLDILVYGAWTAGSSPLSVLCAESWGYSVDVNVKGFLYSIAAALPAMLKNGGGEVVVLGAKFPAGPLCRATRAAVDVLVEEINHEFLGRDIYTSLLEESKPEQCAAAVFATLRHAGDKINEEK